jgi:hypothetical protein
MSDEPMLRLLEEIRDLQRQHLENYREALRNQHESIQMQRDWQQAANRRLRILAIVLVVFLMVVWGIPFLRR